MSYISSPAPSNRQIPLGPLSRGYARKPRRQARLGALLAGYFASTAPQTRAIPLGANLAGRRQVLRFGNRGLGRLGQDSGLGPVANPDIYGAILESQQPVGVGPVADASSYTSLLSSEGSTSTSWFSQQSIINGISNGLIAGTAAFLLLLVAMGGKKR